jgi:hypothetical protein
VWVAYVVPVTTVFIAILRRQRPSAATEPAAAPLITGRTQ